MNFYAISALINFITSFILGIFVLSKSRNSKNVAFFIFCFFVGFWSIAYYFWQITKFPDVALFWCRVFMAGAIFIPVAYLHFVCALVEILKKKKIFLIFSYLLFFLFLLIDFTPYFISHVEPLLSFKFWPIAGPLYSLFLIIWFFYVIYSTYLLLKKYKNSAGIIKLQIKYVIIGMTIGFIGGSTNYFLWYRIPIPPIANILVSVYVAAIAYAIIRYRLMDIRIVARKIFIYFGIAAFAYGIFYFLIWFYNYAFGGVFSATAYVAGLVIAPLFVFSFYFIDRGLKNIANKYFFVSLYNYQETINKLTDELNNYIDLDKIINLIVDTIKKTMQLDRAGVLLINPEINPIRYKIAKITGFDKQNCISLVQNNFLTEYLQRIQKPLVRDELNIFTHDHKTITEQQNFSKLHDQMKHVEISICLPLISSKRLIGIIILGGKISGDAYTKEDLELLNTLSKQAGIAIENALLYKKTQDFSKKLEKEVEKATKELKKAYEELQKLDKVKSEFVSIASHQLRTPLTAVKGYISMMLEKDYGNPPEKMQLPLKNIYTSNERLIKLVNDLLNVSRIEAGRIEIKKESFSLEEIVKSIIEELKGLAEKKGIYLKLEKPRKSLPNISADKDKIRQTIVNIIDNAIHYTVKGGIVIKIEEYGNKLRISIKDTGEGMTKTELSCLFESFSRGKAGTKLWTEGAGLGLYVTKKFIELNKGKIWAESTGKNKGSTFYIELPIK